MRPIDTQRAVDPADTLKRNIISLQQMIKNAVDSMNVADYENVEVCIDQIERRTQVVKDDLHEVLNK